MQARLDDERIVLDQRQLLFNNELEHDPGRIFSAKEEEQEILSQLEGKKLEVKVVERRPIEEEDTLSAEFEEKLRQELVNLSDRRRSIGAAAEQFKETRIRHIQECEVLSIEEETLRLAEEFDEKMRQEEEEAQRIADNLQKQRIERMVDEEDESSNQHRWTTKGGNRDVSFEEDRLMFLEEHLAAKDAAAFEGEIDNTLQHQATSSAKVISDNPKSKEEQIAATEEEREFAIDVGNHKNKPKEELSMKSKEETSIDIDVKATIRAVEAETVVELATKAADSSHSEVATHQTQEVVWNVLVPFLMGVAQLGMVIGLEVAKSIQSVGRRGESFIRRPTTKKEADGRTKTERNLREAIDNEDEGPHRQGTGMPQRKVGGTAMRIIQQSEALTINKSKGEFARVQSDVDPICGEEPAINKPEAKWKKAEVEAAIISSKRQADVVRVETKTKSPSLLGANQPDFVEIQSSSPSNNYRTQSRRRARAKDQLLGFGKALREVLMEEVVVGYGISHSLCNF